MYNKVNKKVRFYLFESPQKKKLFVRLLLFHINKPTAKKGKTVKILA